MGKIPTIEERVGILENREEDCQAKQTERYDGLKDLVATSNLETMKRIERLENKMTGALGVGIVIILTTLANIALALLKK